MLDVLGRGRKCTLLLNFARDLDPALQEFAKDGAALETRSKCLSYSIID